MNEVVFGRYQKDAIVQVSVKLVSKLKDVNTDNLLFVVNEISSFEESCK